MAPEIISLLSSPEAPPADRKSQAPSQTTDFDDEEFPDIFGSNSGWKTSPAHSSILTEPIGRTNNIGHGRDNPPKDSNDFLFVADDFDTTGDLGFSAPSKIQASPRTVRNDRSTSRSMTRTSSAAIPTKPSKPLQSSGPRRWNSIADLIQHTSSPMDMNMEDDPFASSSPPKKSPESKRPGRTGVSNDATTTNRTSTKVFDLTSDFSDLSPVQPRPNKGKQKADWDPISSSMPEMSTTRDENRRHPSSPPRPAKRKATVIELDDSDTPNSEDEFPELDKVRADTSAMSRSFSASPRKLKRSNTLPASTGRKRPPTKTQEEKDLEKKQKVEAREAENERKRLEKERAKKEKALQKEKDKALAEVNKVRVNKSVAQIEMIVDIPQSLAPGFNAQVTSLLDELNVDHTTWNSPIDHVVRWRRKVDKAFNEEKDYFEPIPLRIEREKHVSVVIQAAEFVKLATGSEGIDVAAHVLKMKVAFPERTFIYLIEGLDQWFRKNKTARNRQFQNAARNDATATGAQGRRRNAAHEIVDEEVVEDALLSLQVDHGVLIHKTNAAVETAQWITVFTQHISTIPYRKLRDDISTDAGFSVESGQVKTGDTVKETYILMLQEVARVTAPMAYGIAAEYSTITDLLRGLERAGPLALEDLRKSANRDGRLTDQRIGPAISKRLYKILTCRDPTSTEV
ncbi:ERCC4 domain-containing protein [Seiridium cupressi]